MKYDESIPFRAALFDLDGTLLDSMYVWNRVDELFFESRGIPLPEDYGRALAGKSYRESAEYTIERFGLKDSWEALVAEWTHLSEVEYAQHVNLKPGALNYLRMLKRAGVKLAVATALPPALYRLALERHGILDMFDALCSTNDTGGRGKLSGEVFLLAAERLDVKPEDCAVFEDVLEGILGAKKAGMKAYCVRDAASAHAFDQIAGMADGMVDSLEEMRRYHAFPDNSRRCVIFTARCDGNLKEAYLPHPEDYVVCADGGYWLAHEAGISADCVIGDFDSGKAPEHGNVRRVPKEKDDTDTMLCLKHGLALGFDDFFIVGGFGGRVDHTLANFQMLNFAAAHHAHAAMCDGDNWATVVRNGTARIPARRGKLSVFALDAVCKGVYERGVKYPLSDATLTNIFPLGVSNEFAAPEAEISVDEGALLIVIDPDD